MIIIVMGVSGSGKSRVGQALAQCLGWQFRDADDFHTQAAKEKMKQAIPLNDQDRQPWLEAMRSAIDRWIMAGKNTVLACSALKSSYRQVLQIQYSRVQFIYLKGSFELIYKRLQHRQNHFMKESLLQSQFETLEEPTSSEAIHIDASQSPEVIVQQVINQLNLVD
ncbi:MAG: gluconokinase [Coleofasciculus sp. C1-SOL-03]|uniref:gluconokinase n=1 Tax=Coleofasciculus sp. C1-SOL-03 TaxID=3069522 RepID=UPI0032F2FAF6